MSENENTLITFVVHISGGDENCTWENNIPVLAESEHKIMEIIRKTGELGDYEYLTEENVVKIYDLNSWVQQNIMILNG